MKYQISQCKILLALISIMFCSQFMYSQDCTNEVKWTFDTLSGSQGDEACVKLKVDDFKEVASFAFSIKFDPIIMEYIQTDTIIDGLFMNDGMDSTGTIRVLYLSPTLCTSLPDESMIMELCFKLIGPQNTEANISLSGDHGIRAEVLYGCGASTRISDFICASGGEVTIAGMTSPTQELHSKENIVQIYPNPFTDYIEFDFNDSHHEKLDVEVIDVLGNKATTFSITPNHQNHRQHMSLSNAGLYLLRFQMNGINFVKKLIAQ